MRGNVGVTVRQKEQGGPWWVFVAKNSRRRSKCIGTKRAADAVAEKLRARLALGDFSIFQDEGELLAPYSDRWLDSVKATRKRSTSAFYSFNLKLHILPVLGGKPVSAVTRADCRELITKCRAAKMNRSSLLGVQRTLSAVLSQAVEDGLLAQNPCFRLAARYIGRGDDERVEVQPASREQAAHFLEVVREYYPEYAAFFLTAFRTGLRLGELLALEWADVDLDGRSLRVRRNRTRGAVSSPKSRQARSVDLERPALVFLTPDGNPIDADNLRRRVFRRLTERAKFPFLTLHGMRHTYATLLLANGAPLTYVSTQLGHSSPHVTATVYAHWLPKGDRSAVDSLDSAPQLTASPNAAMN
jgi:integrase